LRFLKEKYVKNTIEKNAGVDPDLEVLVSDDAGGRNVEMGWESTQNVYTLKQARSKGVTHFLLISRYILRYCFQFEHPNRVIYRCYGLDAEVSDQSLSVRSLCKRSGT
jgi:hypothetical protein